MGSVKYLVKGLGVHAVCGNSAMLFHFMVERDVVPVRLFIPEHVAVDFLIYQISTVTREDGALREDHVLLGADDPVPATLFSSTDELTEEVLRQCRPEAKVEDYLPQYPCPLRMRPVKRGDQIRVGVTNVNACARNITGALIVVPRDEEHEKYCNLPRNSCGNSRSVKDAPSSLDWPIDPSEHDDGEAD